jgi:microcompartment protein CcmL/EutN
MSLDTIDHCGGRAAMSPRSTGQSVQALGCLETRSVALGVEAADAMAKSAEISLLVASTACPGKFLIVFCGSVAATRSAMQVGVELAGDAMSDQMMLPSVHPQVIPAISAMSAIERIEAIGIIETFTMASGIRAADQAVKTAKVDLIEVRLGRALAGKSFVSLTGHVSAVRQAVAAGVKALSDEAMLLATTVIPSPHPELVEKLL